MSRRQYHQRLFVLLEIPFQNDEVEQPQEMGLMRLLSLQRYLSFIFQFSEL